MTVITVLIIGFLFGLRHALDADHVAAVAALATRSSSVNETVRMGLAWGLGHTVTLFIVCAVILFSGISFPQQVANILEFIVGLILVGLGIDVLTRIIRSRVHVHVHAHRNTGTHIHFHSHEGDENHAISTHEHKHKKLLPRRALLVGLMHGLAGSAALLLLALGNQISVLHTVSYIIVFGLGSIIGMALLSLTIAWPLMSTAKFGKINFKIFNVFIGITTTAVGFFIIAKTFPLISVLIA